MVVGVHIYYRAPRSEDQLRYTVQAPDQARDRRALVVSYAVCKRDQAANPQA